MANVLGNIIKKGEKAINIFLNQSKIENNVKKISMFSNSEHVFTWKNALPVGNYNSGVVARVGKYNNTYSDGIDIYIIGGANDSTRLQRIVFSNGGIYAWDFSGSNPGSKLPVSFNNNAAVIYNDNIHIFVGTAHYRHIYTGSSTTSGNWTKLSTIPFSVSNGRAVVFNNQIHLFQGTYHYKYNNGSWTKVSTIPYNFNSGCAFIFQDKINLYGGTGGSTKWYQWNGANWIEITGSKVSCNPGIIIPRSDTSLYVISGSDTTIYIAYLNNGSTSASYSSLVGFNVPNSVQYGNAVNVEGTIYIIGANSSTYYKDIQMIGLKQIVMS